MLSGSFTKFVGIGFIILGILRFTPFVNATGKWLLYVSLAALFLILYDFLEFFFNREDSRKDTLKHKSARIAANLFVLLAAMSIIVFPYLKVDIQVKMVNQLSDAFTLASLGLAVVMIGLKSKKSFRRFRKKRADARAKFLSFQGANEQRMLSNYIQNF